MGHLREKLQSEISDYTCKKPPTRNKKDTRQEVEQPELLQTMKKPAAAISPTNGAGTNPDHINKKTKVRQESDKKRSNNVFLPGPTSMETTRSIVVKDVYQNRHDQSEYDPVLKSSPNFIEDRNRQNLESALDDAVAAGLAVGHATVDVTRQKGNGEEEFGNLTNDTSFSSEMEKIEIICSGCKKVEAECHECLFGLFLTHEILHKYGKKNEDYIMTKLEVHKTHYRKYIMLYCYRNWRRFGEYDSKKNILYQNAWLLVLSRTQRS